MNIRVLSAGIVVAGMATLTASSCLAQAFDDRPGTFGPIMGFVGIGTDNTDKAGEIDFRERAPLVVPKNLDLPAPQPGVRSRVANWPQDQDVVRRREEAARARVPQQIEVNKNPALTKAELMAGRSDDAPVAVDLCANYTSGAPDCAPTAMDKIKRVFTLGGGDTERNVVIIGKEPDRKFLTEPPRGYRTATKTTKVTTEGGYERPDAANPGQYYRDQAKRDEAYR